LDVFRNALPGLTLAGRFFAPLIETRQGKPMMALSSAKSSIA
jgi:hypothetical protein